MDGIPSVNTAATPVRTDFALSSFYPSQPTTVSPQSQLDNLLAVARDPASGPVRQAQALADADAITGGRAQTNAALQTSGPLPTLQLVAANDVGKGKQVTKLGADAWAERRNGISTQLQTESNLQRAGAPEYSKDLANSATKMRHGASSFPAGTYQSASSTRYVKAGTAVPNPLQIDTISATNSLNTVRKLDTNIAKNNSRIAELEHNNQKLDREIRSLWPIDVRRVAKEAVVAKNTIEIKALEGQNLLMGVQRSKAINDARLQSSKDDNGKMFQAVANNADKNKTPVIFINGVNTDKYRSSMQAMEVSQLLGVPVNHVVNVSSMDKLVSGGAKVGTDNVLWKSTDPNVTDQRVQQLLTGNGEAAATTANAILDQLKSTTGRVKVVGYSQGAAIGAEALRKVNDILTYQNVSSADRAKMLGRVDFVGIGPGAAKRHISQAYQPLSGGARVREVKELQAVKYKTISDQNDPIAKLLNVSNPDGSRTSGTDLGRARAAIGQLTNGKGILPHLSYFKGYEATDPGSIYNPIVAKAIHQWYAGGGRENEIVSGINNGK